MASPYKVVINGHDYTQYIKQKTGIEWSRENTNDEDAGRDEDDVMHPNVRSHQRKLTFSMGPMPYSVAMQLEADLESGDDGFTMQYPDLCDGMCTRLFYNTSISAAEEQFRDNDLIVDNIKFTVISIKEATV